MRKIPSNGPWLHIRMQTCACGHTHAHVYMQAHTVVGEHLEYIFGCNKYIEGLLEGVHQKGKQSSWSCQLCALALSTQIEEMPFPLRTVTLETRCMGRNHQREPCLVLTGPFSGWPMVPCLQGVGGAHGFFWHLHKNVWPVKELYLRQLGLQPLYLRKGNICKYKISKSCWNVAPDMFWVATNWTYANHVAHFLHKNGMPSLSFTNRPSCSHLRTCVGQADWRWEGGHRRAALCITEQLGKPWKWSPLSLVSMASGSSLAGSTRPVRLMEFPI